MNFGQLIDNRMKFLILTEYEKINSTCIQERWNVSKIYKKSG
mgnify:CR=1 FL=1